jgi:hypothetical protein|nr:MAG TPA: cytochrome c-552 [Caudoviricetes sp.]
MGAISKIAEKCMACHNVDKCSHKRIEACAYYEYRNMAELTAMPLKSDMVAPVLRETVNMIVNGQAVKVYKDEIEKTLYKHLYDGLRCEFVNGA